MTATTSLLVALLALVTLAVAHPTFEEWALKHGKTYATEAAEAHARENYAATLVRIDALNNLPGNEAVFAVNVFSDLSEDEFAAQKLNRGYRAPTKVPKRVEQFPRNAPQNFAWNAIDNAVGSPIVSPVKNQEQCGSCWAFSATETIESAWAMANHSMQILAPQQIVDCDKVDDGCNGGNTNTAYQYVMSAGGLETENSYPYTGQDGTCKAEKSLEVVSITGFKYATTSKNEEEMIAASYAVGPLSICLSAARGWQDYQSGVLTPLACLGLVDHCVAVTGWELAPSSGKPYWIVRNSWGTVWGENPGYPGYIFLEYGHNTCDMASDVTYVTVA